MLRRLWNGSAPLTVTGLVMLPVLAGAILGLIVDPRILAGAPVWLKPAKFAVSIAIYSLTLAWIFTFIPAWTRTRRTAEWTTAVVMVLEIAIISLQAFRGTTSHFNVATVFDATLFSVMGTAIVVQTLSSIAVAVALWRQQLANRALGWALRFGMTMTIVGALTGGLMTRPTPGQLSAARAGERLLVAGAHTVGAPDGGPGLPGTGWSTEHGDLRVAHFVGLHALQVLAIVALALARRVNDSVRVRLTLTAAASYAALYVILLSQALRGHSVVAPHNSTIALFGVWALGTAIAAVVSTVRTRPTRTAALV